MMKNKLVQLTFLLFLAVGGAMADDDPQPPDGCPPFPWNESTAPFCYGSPRLTQASIPITNSATPVSVGVTAFAGARCWYYYGGYATAPVEVNLPGCSFNGWNWVCGGLSAQENTIQMQYAQSSAGTSNPDTSLQCSGAGTISLIIDNAQPEVECSLTGNSYSAGSIQYANQPASCDVTDDNVVYKWTGRYVCPGSTEPHDSNNLNPGTEMHSTQVTFSPVMVNQSIEPVPCNCGVDTDGFPIRPTSISLIGTDVAGNTKEVPFYCADNANPTVEIAPPGLVLRSTDSYIAGRAGDDTKVDEIKMSVKDTGRNMYWAGGDSWSTEEKWLGVSVMGQEGRWYRWQSTLPGLTRKELNTIVVKVKAVDVFGKAGTATTGGTYIPERVVGSLFLTGFSMQPMVVSVRSPEENSISGGAVSFMAGPESTTTWRPAIPDTIEKLLELRVNVQPERLKWDGNFFIKHIKNSRWKMSQQQYPADGFPAMPTEASLSSNIIMNIKTGAITEQQTGRGHPLTYEVGYYEGEGLRGVPIAIRQDLKDQLRQEYVDVSKTLGDTIIWAVKMPTRAQLSVQDPNPYPELMIGRQGYDYTTYQGLGMDLTELKEQIDDIKEGMHEGGSLVKLAGQTLEITAGLRTPIKTLAVSSNRNSPHMYGKAVDFQQNTAPALMEVPIDSTITVNGVEIATTTMVEVKGREYSNWLIWRYGKQTLGALLGILYNGPGDPIRVYAEGKDPVPANLEYPMPGSEKYNLLKSTGMIKEYRFLHLDWYITPK